MSTTPMMFDCPVCRRLVVVHSDPKRVARECCRTEALNRVRGELVAYVIALNQDTRHANEHRSYP